MVVDLGIDSGQISSKGFEDHFDLAVHLAQPAGNQAKGSIRSARNTRIISQCRGCIVVRAVKGTNIATKTRQRCLSSLPLWCHCGGVWHI